MFDKSPYLMPIQHAACMAGEKESPGEVLQAFKMDQDGVANAIGFHAGIFNKVDYFLIHNHTVQLIELSDLKECIEKNHTYITKELDELKTAIEKESQLQGVPIREITTDEKKEIVKTAWKKDRDELCNKWSGSIAVIERLYRKTIESPDSDPRYQLLIVCRNHTDIKMIDSLKNQLSGMMGNVKVCNTQTLKSQLIKIE